MCPSSIFGGGGSPDVVSAPTPSVAATAPPAEEVAEAPVVNEGDKRRGQAATQRKGTSSLRINLNLGGLGGTSGSGDGGGGTSALAIPR